MWLSVLSSLVCFAIAIILFSPPFRSCPFYKELSFFFLFEAAKPVVDSVVVAIWPRYDFMQWISYVGTVTLAGYLLYKLIVIYKRDMEESKNDSSEDPNKFS